MKKQSNPKKRKAIQIAAHNSPGNSKWNNADILIILYDDGTIVRHVTNYNKSGNSIDKAYYAVNIDNFKK